MRERSRFRSRKQQRLCQRGQPNGSRARKRGNLTAATSTMAITHLLRWKTGAYLTWPIRTMCYRVAKEERPTLQRKGPSTHRKQSPTANAHCCGWSRTWLSSGMSYPQRLNLPLFSPLSTNMSSACFIGLSVTGHL